MNWGTCKSGSNNIHFDFPPIMMDGRNYSKWQPGSVINEQIRKNNNIQTNWQYRSYLINNADKIIKSNQIEACDECCYCPAVKTNEQTKNTPFLYSSCVENSQPYGYQNSDLKELYLSSYDLQARMIAPVLTQDQYLQQKYPNPN